MNHLLMPNHALGTLQQATVHYQLKIWPQIRSFIASFLAITFTNRYAISIIIALTILLSPPLTGLVESPVAQATANASQTIIARTDAEVFYLNAVNSLRTQRGLAPLIIDTRLSASATQKGNDMALQGYWAHYAPNGTAYSDYIWRTSPDAYRVGENLARCFTSRQEAFQALVASPTHYAIMTGQFTNFGVSEVQDAASGCTYTTMHFAQYLK